MFEDRKNRMTQKLTLKQKNQQRKLLQDQFKKESEEFERRNLGNFDKIYPLPMEEVRLKSEKAQLSEKLSTIQKQLAEMEYRNLTRQNDRYTQIIEICLNKDSEKELKLME